MTIEINGMAHVILTVSRFDVARDFYRKLLAQFGMKPVFDGDKFFYCVGGRTAIGIEPCDPALASERFVQQRVGLHHLCLRARSREDVDRCATLLKEMAATIIRGWKAAGRRAITTCFSRIRMESGWRYALSRAPVCCARCVVRSLRGLCLRV
jgi:catechol 2,3-dioxygenase-like lactoylglutathione lyase family enzyme